MLYKQDIYNKYKLHKNMKSTHLFFLDYNFLI